MNRDFLSILPTNLLSWLTGTVASWRWPKICTDFLTRLTCLALGIELGDAVVPVGGFRSVQEVFLRKMQPGKRPCSGVICSPVDGFFGQAQKVQDGDWVTQAKGQEYSLSELFLGPSETPQNLNISWIGSFYLAPKDYHRVHAPCSGVLKVIRIVPGELWPVNPYFVRWIPKLYVRNQRVIFEIEPADDPSTTVYVAMIGALNVGSIEVAALQEISTNRLRQLIMPMHREIYFPQRPAIEQGEELGAFRMGSSVVLGLSQGAWESYNLNAQPGREIVYGTSLLAKE